MEKLTTSPMIRCELHRLMHSSDHGCPDCRSPEFLLEVCEKAVSLYGPKLQLLQLVEEMAELTVAILKYTKQLGPVTDVLEEMVDVDLMLVQAKVIFKQHTSILNRTRAEKLFRQMQRIQGHKALAKGRVHTQAPRRMRL